MLSPQHDKKEDEKVYALEPCSSVLQGTVKIINNDPDHLKDRVSVKYSTFNVICAGWNICNSWAAIAATLPIGLVQGGPVTILYGIVLVVVCLGSCAATLAELASVYPTSGGQYHYTSILSPKHLARGLSYCCGSLNIFSWITTCASACLLPSQFIMAMVIIWDSSYVPKAWHYFLVYQACNFLVMAYNMTLARSSNWVHNVGFAVSITSFLAITITCLAMSDQKQSSEFVWTAFINETGWSTRGIVFLTGISNPNYIFAGLDGAIHLAEECVNPRATVPKALISTICIGFVSAFVFAISMLYSMTDFTAVLESSTGVPVYEIWIQALGSQTGATVFLVAFTCLAFFGINGCQQTSSRLIWSFARDEALVTSAHLSRVPEVLQVPVWALLANSIVSGLIGCIYLGSSTAFNAIVGSGLVLQQLCFAVPAALLLYRRRSDEFLPPGRYINLGLFGWAANIITVAFAVLVTIFYDFPFSLPVTPVNMNYTVVVIGGFGIFALVNWLVYAKKHYKGPRLEQFDEES